MLKTLVIALYVAMDDTDTRPYKVHVNSEPTGEYENIDDAKEAALLEAGRVMEDWHARP